MAEDDDVGRNNIMAFPSCTTPPPCVLAEAILEGAQGGRRRQSDARPFCTGAPLKLLRERDWEGAVQAGNAMFFFNI